MAAQRLAKQRCCINLSPAMIPKQFLSSLRSATCAALLAASVATPVAAFAQSQRPAGRFTIEQVMSSPFPSDLTAAEKANRIAWSVVARGVRNVWVADAPNFAARQLTNFTGDDGMPIASVRLTPDGRTVLFARGSETNEKNEVADPVSDVHERRQQVFAVDVDSDHKPRLLGEMNCDEEGCEAIEVSPDGQWAVWAARKQLWLAPVNGAQPSHALAWIRGENESPKWSPDSKHVAFVSRRGDHSFIGVYEFGRDTIRWIAP